MAIKRLTKEDHPLSFGVFSPVGHVVVAFADGQAAHAAAQALREAGFDDEDILQYTAAEESEEMSRMLDGISGAAGFGHEVSLMRLYKALADEGCCWLVVYAPDKAHCERVVSVARQHGAKLAEKYGRLVIEDLL
jgi:hypothetical protein